MSVKTVTPYKFRVRPPLVWTTTQTSAPPVRALHVAKLSQNKPTKLNVQRSAQKPQVQIRAAA